MKISDILNIGGELEEGILYEGGLGRVLQHTKNPFVVITAFRDEYSLSQNRSRNKQLESKLKKFPAGGIKLTGFWDEAPDGMDYEEARKKGELTPLKEESYFVPMPKNFEFDEFRTIAIKIMKEFHQDAILIGDGKKAWLEYKDGKIESKGSMSVTKMAQAYSRLRNQPKRTFVFEGTVQPSNNMHRQVFKERGIMWFNTTNET